MKRVWRWAVSMLLVAAMVLSLPAGALPARAAGSLPTKATECGTSGFMPEFLCVAFEKNSDQNWLNAITTVTVNGSEYTHKETIGYFESVSKAWTVGSYTGTYGSYPALKITTDGMSYPVTIVASATGYPEATITVTKQDYSSYVAEIKENSSTPDPEPTEYSIAVSDSISNGTVSVDSNKAQEGDTVKVTASPAENYELDRITVTDGEGNSIDVSEDGTFTMPAANVTVSATFKQKGTDPEPDPDPSGLKEIALSQVTVSESSWRDTWYFTISGDGDYVGKITSLSVNDTTWEKTTYGLYTGSKYKLNESENRIELAEQSYGSPEAIKSGDVVTITADGYKPLTFKFVNVNGKVSLEPNDGQGDNYELRVKLVGSFDSAITGQEYDAISGASTGVSLSKNSSVTVYGALVEKGTEPDDNDWQELDAWTSGSSGIDLDSSKCRAYVVADTDKGTAESKVSGLSGVYLVISSDLTLSGTAKDPGDYLVYVEIADTQGRTATSNKIPVRVYSGDETLANQMVTGNMTQTQDGKYMWDMEPWAIKQFGSNVSGESESVRVLPGLKAWYGSHTSGTYGYLGYDLAWSKVMAGEIPQTLYIPKGCDLTLVNMEILSSVRIVIEDGGKLTLRDSVVQGIIDVEKGGTFSMNYDSYSGKFLTGASVCGQVRLQDGAILENAAIYSHANYLANGDLTDRTAAHPVVTATGNVTVKGDVYIQGDDGGSVNGQTGLLVKDGTVTVEKGGTLAVFGGEGMLGWDGGTAIELNNGKINGDGKLVALGGTSDAIQGVGGDAISGNGTISTEETFLRGGTAYTGHEPGKAVSSDKVQVDSDSTSIQNGVEKNTYGDPYENLYWKSGIEVKPPLSLYTTTPVQKYTVTVEQAENGTATADKTTAKAGETITITTTSDDEYTLQSLTVIDAQNKEVSVEQSRSRATQTYTFTMPASNVTVKAVFARITYKVNIADIKNGKVSASAATAAKGETVTVTTIPDSGYQLGSLTVTDADGNAITVTDGRFTMPGSDVTIQATYTKKSGPSKSDDSGNSGSGSSHRHSGSSSSSSSSAASGSSTSTSASSTSNNAAGVTGADNAAAAAIAEAGAVNNAAADANAAAGTIAEGGSIGTESGAGNDHIIATGDDSHMTLWLAIMVLSAAALAATTYIRRNDSVR